LTWDPNTEGDVTGYSVSFGTTLGQYTQTIDVGNQTFYQFTEPDPSKSYFFVVRAYNSAGVFSPYSQSVQSTPSATMPFAVTGSPSGVTTTIATLTGSANPKGLTATGYFQYGQTTGYGTTTASAGLGAGTTTVDIPPAAIAGLSCGTAYHVRAAATNSVGTAFGNDVTFTTAACQPPTVTTGGVQAISASGATLTGTVNPNGTTTSAMFQYGPTTQYASTSSTSTIASGLASYSTSIGGLQCGTLYHYRAAASNSGGSATGADLTFTTTACAQPVQPSQPAVTTGGLISVTLPTATLGATVDGKGASVTVSMAYGLTTSYGSTTSGTVVNNSGPASVAIAVAGLVCDKTYHYRAIATSIGGTATGADATFGTGVCPTPPVITSQPRDEAVKLGWTPSIWVVASGPGPLTYQWYRGTTGDTSRPIAGAVNATYQLPPVTSVGSYWVRVSNRSGSVDSRTATISLKGRYK